MILSHDHNHVFFSVTKTGSTTMRSLLQPYGTPISRVGQHAPRYMFGPEYTTLHPDATATEIDGVMGYAFWRDPVERFISAVTYARQYPVSLINMFPELFDTGMEFDLTGKMLPTRMNQRAFDTLPNKIKNKIINPIDERGLLVRVENIIKDALAFMPQQTWFDAPNMVALNFHDYTNEAKRLIGIFGGDSSIEVPVLNPKPSFIPDPVFSDDTKEFIKAMYMNDYMYDPRNL